MAYREVKPSIKARAVIDVVKGEGISGVSEKYGISRASIYNWLDLAENALQEYFNGGNTRKEREIKDLKNSLKSREEYIGGLKSKIKEREEEIRAIDEKLHNLENITRPRECDECGCEKIYKNGYYEITTQYFCRQLEKSDKKIKIQHFVCAACQKSLCVVDPFNNLFILSPDREEGMNGEWVLSENPGEISQNR